MMMRLGGELHLQQVALLLLLFLLLLVGRMPPECGAISAEGKTLLSFLECFQDGTPARTILSNTWRPDDDSPCGTGGGAASSHDIWTGITCDARKRVSAISLSAPLLPPGSGSHCSLAAHLNLSSLPYLTTLSLPSLNLSGPLPDLDPRAPLRHLTFLDLSYNNLSGPFPPRFFAALPALSSLSLQFNQLSGPIPAQIFVSANLSSLLLHDNRLSGTIPPELGRLDRLQVFRAGGNPSLWGPIPPEISNCSSLTDIGIAFTAVSGAIPGALGLLPNLASLRLFSTNISGPIPPDLANCTQLLELFLFDNHLEGPLPPELGRLTNLQFLYLWGNELSGPIPPELGRLPSLEVLELSQNKFTGSIPVTFGLLSRATGIYLSINNLSGPIPVELGNCSKVTNLELDRNGLSGRIPAELGNLTDLVLLFLWNNSLEGPIPESFASCGALQFLDFSWNRLSGPLPPAIFRLPALYKFLLVGNRLSGPIPSTIGICKSLYRLRLGRNQLSGPIPSQIGCLQNLTFFDISENRIEGEIPREIGSCTRLQLFDAGHNLLTGTLPSELGSLSNLQLLDLSFNDLSGALPPDVICGLNELTKLNLNGNRFSGTIPTEIKTFRKLTALDLSSNRFSGEIPAALGQISTLSVSLNICCNGLTGSIPVDFGQLFVLGELDMSHNNLSGKLDPLARMGSLVTLNISYNRFTGPLPDTYLFRSMATSNYAGIPGLCGGADDSCFGQGEAAGHDNDDRVGEDERQGSSMSRGVLSRRRRGRTIVGFLFGSFGCMFLLGLLSLYALMRYKSASTARKAAAGAGVMPRDEPWELTPFQKLNFTLEEVLDCMRDEANIVGKGYSGVVYKAKMRGGEVVAVKRIVVPKMPAAAAAQSKRRSRHRDFFAAEVDTLRNVRHNNIVRLLGFASNRTMNLLLYDYMPNGSLGEYMHERKKMLDWDARYNIVLGAAQGLAYLHHDCAPPILHRDVKPNNILLGACLEPYLADFGLAKFNRTIVDVGRSRGSSLYHSSSIVAGSYGYIAPEYAYTLVSTMKGDVYSYGVVMLEVLTGKRAVEVDHVGATGSCHIIEWVHEMMHCHHDVVEILDPRLRGMPDPFIKEMLQALHVAMDCVHPAPDERPTMRHVVNLLTTIRREEDLQHHFTKLDHILSTNSPSSYCDPLLRSPCEPVNNIGNGTHLPSSNVISASSTTFSSLRYV